MTYTMNAPAPYIPAKRDPVRTKKPSIPKIIPKKIFRKVPMANRLTVEQQGCQYPALAGDS
jgi:hypothetical protein